MGRIGEGAVPRQSTLQKYNILPAEVDAARMAVDLDPLYEDNNYQSTTTLQNIDLAYPKFYLIHLTPVIVSYIYNPTMNQSPRSRVKHLTL